MNVVLSYHNLLDDWQDEKNYPKHVISIMLKKDYARISRKYPRQVEAVEAYMRKLNMLESKRETNLDAIAGLTGEMLGEIFFLERRYLGRGTALSWILYGKIHLSDGCI